jgi:16S rRNA (cytidine1402-2'-O)-methyltransferase
MALYIVGTPIGNLGDMTLRAVETLKKVERIYAEDTRRSRILLNHYEISTPLDSFHHHSSPHKLAAIIEQLATGHDLALVTDAGTPALADPGGLLVQAARQAGISVVPIPGVSAVTTLLSVAGAPANQFYFAGYVPTKKGRQTFVKTILAHSGTVVFFETAPRLVKFLELCQELGGADRALVVGRELTKQFEEVRRGTVAELLNYFQTNAPRGELTLVLTPV